MRQRGIKAWALALAVTAALAAPAYRVCAADDADIDAKIMSAKTAADHEAIAAYYTGQATEARAKAASHQKMGAEYKKLPHSAKAGLDRHCASLATDYTAAAKQYDALAKAHQDMAKHVK
jgi:hypothetical protein